MNPFLAEYWDKLVRWRTWIVNTMTALLSLVAAILAAPEVLALIPPQYLVYVLAANAVLNILMRPWPAVRAGDPEAQIDPKSKRPGK